MEIALGLIIGLTIGGIVALAVLASVMVFVYDIFFRKDKK